MDLFALERALPVERDRRRELRVAHERGADDRSERKRRRERDELDAPDDESRDQAERCEPCVRDDPRRVEPRHPAARSDVFRRRRRHGRERLRHDVLAAHALHPELGPQRQPVRERRNRDRLHVLGDDEVAAVERRLRARELQQREAAARARADREPLRAPRRGYEVDDVARDRVGDVHLLERVLHRDERRRIDDGTAARARPRRGRAGARASRARARGSGSRCRCESGSGRAAPRAADTSLRTRSGSASRAR